MELFRRETSSMALFIRGWIKEELRKASASGCVVSLNGGIDSAVTAALVRKACDRDGMLALIMPCHSSAEDEADAMLAAEAFDMPVEKIDVTASYDALADTIEASCGKLGRIARSEIKPRLRMAALYSVAQVRNFLVVGSSNKDAMYFGDFTKYGDVSVDMLPLGNMSAGEVKEIAEFIGIPGEIINRPRAGSSLMDNPQGREDDITYGDIDRFVATGTADTNAAMRIKEAYEISQHRRNPVHIPTMQK